MEDPIADDLESQEVDLKQWEDDFKEMMKILVSAVVGFANAGEGLVIAGVKKRAKGCEKAILGIPRGVDPFGGQKSIDDQTDPHITVKVLSEKGVKIEVDELLILNYLLRHRKISAQTAAEICQRSVRRIAGTLNKMDVDSHILTAGGKGRGRYYALSNENHRLLSEDVQYSRNEQAEEAALKAPILTLLKKQPLSNQEIRQITGRTAQ